MGEATDKLKAAGNKVAGNVKEAVGKATDNERLEAEGKAQQVKGTGQDVAGSVKGALGDKV
ncbi:MAG: general stress protein CsbD [Sphingomonadales bacterium RIFCSPLOWO2_12_FULL_63_15]|nr:MAG: general stress protein CsbD [Sphingomonadales bacterium RIFCSPLOWO2_12_FULL_63_15]